MCNSENELRVIYHYQVFGTTIIVGPPAGVATWYQLWATDKQKACLMDVAIQIPKIFESAGVQRY